MKAVIMAGGEGTRLRPLTSNQPKPMLPMANVPMMEHVVGLLRTHGITEIVVTVAFMANAIRTYFGDGSEFGVRMVYATEETPLGTAGSVRNAMDELDERFLVISGDVLTDVDLGAVIDFHDRRGALATLALKAVENPLEFGIVITNEDGSIERFLEKPGWGQVFSDTINTGIYVLEPEIFDYIPEGRPVDFSGETFPAALEAGRPVYGCVVDGYWEDVGTLEAYVKAHEDILSSVVSVHVPGFEVRPGVWVGKGTEVDPTATIEGPAVLGENCSVGPGAVLGQFVSLGSNVRVGEHALVEHAVVHDGAYLGPHVRVEGAVIGRGTTIRRGARCDSGVVIGNECVIGEQAELKTGVKVYPYKTVDTGAVVNSSIVWESRGARMLFGRDGVRGIANVDVSPELAVRLSMAWASTLDRGATVVASRDTSRVGRVLKRAVMVGCNAAGINVEDLEAATIPVTRFLVQSTSAVGGLTVRLDPNDPQSVVIRFFDADGVDLAEADQRKIERLYHREDVRRVRATEIGDIGFPPRTLEYYTAALMGSVDLEPTRRARPKLVLDYSFGTASFVMPTLLAKVGAEVLAVNPFANTAAFTAFDREASARRVAELVVASGADLGAVIDPNGEHLTLVDDGGHVLTDDEALLVLLTLVTRSRKDARVALPVAASRAAERICEENGATIQWTKLSSSSLMEAAEGGGVDFAASQLGGFIFPDFLPAYDAAATLVELLAMLTEAGCRIEQVRIGIPPVHIAHDAVETPWEAKGLVMRSLVEDLDPASLTLVDGVKVADGTGWVLVIPDPEEAVTHIWAEGSDASDARSRIREFSHLIRRILAEPRV